MAASTTPKHSETVAFWSFVYRVAVNGRTGYGHDILCRIPCLEV